jgi:hypothetical protein
LAASVSVEPICSETGSAVMTSRILSFMAKPPSLA